LQLGQNGAIGTNAVRRANSEFRNGFEFAATDFCNGALDVRRNSGRVTLLYVRVSYFELEAARIFCTNLSLNLLKFLEIISVIEF